MFSRKYFLNICITFNTILNKIKTCICAMQKIFQSIINAFVCFMNLQIKFFTTYIELCFIKSFLYTFSCSSFKFFCFGLLITNNLLFLFRKHYDIILHNVLSNLHGLSYRFVIICISKNTYCFSCRIKNQSRFCFLSIICSN